MIRNAAYASTPTRLGKLMMALKMHFRLFRPPSQVSSPVLQELSLTCPIIGLYRIK